MFGAILLPEANSSNKAGFACLLLTLVPNIVGVCVWSFRNNLQQYTLQKKLKPFRFPWQGSAGSQQPDPNAIRMSHVFTCVPHICSEAEAL